MGNEQHGVVHRVATTANAPNGVIRGVWKAVMQRSPHGIRTVDNEIGAGVDDSSPNNGTVKERITEASFVLWTELPGLGSG